MDGVEHALGQRDDQIVNGSDEREADRPAVHRAVVAEEFTEQRQRNERDGERIEEHQHRQRIADDGAEAEVRKQQRHEAENDCPDAVLWPVGEERAERLGAARDETDGGLEARERHRGGEDEETGGAEVVLCDLRERRAAVLAGFKHAAALRAGDRDGDVDERHQKAAENARADGAPRHSGGIVHAEVTDDLHDDDAEGKTRQRVHGVVPFEETSEKRLGRVVAERLDIRDGRTRREERDDDQNAEEDEKAGVQNFADPGQDLARAQCEKERRSEKRYREEQQVQCVTAILRKHLLKSHGE